MILQNDEYKIQDNGIWISKKVLEEWRNHYAELAKPPKMYDNNVLLYIGKRDVLIDLLKIFDK